MRLQLIEGGEVGNVRANRKKGQNRKKMGKENKRWIRKGKQGKENIQLAAKMQESKINALNA